MGDVTYIKKAIDIPSSEHYAIIVDHSVSTDDGYHGYSIENYFEYRVYKTREAWEEAIRALHERNSTSFKAMQVIPATVKVEIKINPGPKEIVYRKPENAS